MTDIISSSIVVLLGLLVVFVATLGAPRVERSYVLGALVVHFVFSITMYIVMERIFIISDVHGYVDESLPLRLLLNANPGRWLLEVGRALIGLPNELPSGGGPSGNMVNFTAVGLWATGSVWGMFLLCTCLSFFGKWALYAGLRDELRWQDTRPLLLAALLIPSCVYWTSGLVKEAFAISGLGFLFRGFQRLMQRPAIGAVLLLLMGAILVAGFKPYFLFAFVVAAGMWLLLAKVKRAPEFAPIIVSAGLVLGVGGVALLGSYFKDYSVGNLGRSIATQQSYVQQTTGGSDYSIGDPNERSLAGQLAFAPLALGTSLARPFPFEVHNATAAVASVEVFALLILLLRAARKLGLRRSLRTFVGSPMVMFAAVFVLVGGTGVGLATTNFGTLSRYRTPLLPFYAVVIVVLRESAKEKRATAIRPSVPQALIGQRALAGRRLQVQRSSVRNPGLPK